MVLFDAGVLALGWFRADTAYPEPACRLPSGGASCTAARFAPWAGEDRSEHGSLGLFRPLPPLPDTWERFFAGHGRVLALRRGGGFAMDAIDPQGLVTPLFASTESFIPERVVETTKGLLAFATRAIGELEPRELISVAVALDGVPSHATVNEPRGYRFASAGFYVFQGREVAKLGMRTFHGEFDVAALPEKDGSLGTHVALAFTEAILPPKRSGHTPPIIFDGDKQSCAASRPMTDPTVRKRTHVMRLSPTGEVLSDNVVRLPAQPQTPQSDYQPPMRLRATRAGLEINGFTLARDLRFVSAKRPKVSEPDVEAPSSIFPFTGPPAQRALTAGFDAASGEGVVLFYQAERLVRGRRVNPQGEPIGEAFDAPEFSSQEGSLSLVARLAGDWFCVNQTSLVNLTTHGAQRQVRLRPAGGPPTLIPLSVVARPPSTVEILALGAGESEGANALLRVSVDVESGDVRTLSDKLSLGPPANLTALPLPAGGWEVWQAALGSHVRHLRTENGGAWVEDEGLGSGDKQVLSIEAHPVWGDTVVVGSHPHGQLALWMSTRKEQTLPSPPAFPDSARVRPHFDSGPLLWRGSRLLPARAGDPFDSPAGMTDAYERCPFALPTGERRLLLVCGERTRTDVPSARVGVRVLRY